MKFSNWFKFAVGFYTGILIMGVGLLWSAYWMSNIGPLYETGQYLWVAACLLIAPSGLLLALLGISFIALAFSELR